MSQGHWLFVTLTAGLIGELLAIELVAGVALMGQARGQSTCFSHPAGSGGLLAASPIPSLVS
ncbi:MAG: hypothetical protein VST67_07855 [Nitrospirota bacterium]|nr:hypothetical protein [Nitrospirota bacterium]